MKRAYSKIPYDYSKIQLTRVYSHPSLAAYQQAAIQTPASRNVYGELAFPELPTDRTYTMACFVTSLDGKIAYPDNPAGPVIAQSNFLDPHGAVADFWVLNLLRANADAIFVGAGTMQKEPNSTFHVFDEELEAARGKAGMPQAPWAVVCSLDGRDIPFEDMMFDNQYFMVNTSPQGADMVKEKLRQPYYVVGPYTSIEQVEDDKESIAAQFHACRFAKAPVIVTGEGCSTDSAVVLRILKVMGMDKVVVESPSYCHSLLSQGLLDEFVFNYSCVYIGGTAIGFGNGMAATTSVDHPHTEMLTIHSHSPSFFYFRHKVMYHVAPIGYLGQIH